MKIASYNIASGGFDGFDHRSKTPHRISDIQKAVKSIDADIIGLPETFRWDEIYSDSDLKKLFGYPKVYGVNLQDKRLIDLGHNGGVTVLSRLSETTFETFRIETRNIVLASIGSIKFAFVYLDDLSEDVRIEQIGKLLAKVKDSEKTIMLGDFNAFKQSDNAMVKKNMREFKKSNPEIYTMHAGPLAEMMRGEVVNMVETRGFRDLGEGCGMTFPTSMFPAKTSGPLVRLDYAFSTDNIICRNFKVHRGAIFDKASDHYPISVEIDTK